MKNKMTMKELKKKYDEAVMKVLNNPFKGLKAEEEADTKMKIMTIMTGILLLQQLRKELFGEEQ